MRIKFVRRFEFNPHYRVRVPFGEGNKRLSTFLIAKQTSFNENNIPKSLRILGNRSESSRIGHAVMESNFILAEIPSRALDIPLSTAHMKKQHGGANRRSV